MNGYGWFPRKRYLWAQKFEFQIIFLCHKIFFYFLPNSFNMVKTILSSWLSKTGGGWIWIASCRLLSALLIGSSIQLLFTELHYIKSVIQIFVYRDAIFFHHALNQKGKIFFWKKEKIFLNALKGWLEHDHTLKMTFSPSLSCSRWFSHSKHKQRYFISSVILWAQKSIGLITGACV